MAIFRRHNSQVLPTVGNTVRAEQRNDARTYSAIQTRGLTVLQVRIAPVIVVQVPLS